MGLNYRYYALVLLLVCLIQLVFFPDVLHRISSTFTQPPAFSTSPVSTSKSSGQPPLPPPPVPPSPSPQSTGELKRGCVIPSAPPDEAFRAVADGDTQYVVEGDWEGAHTYTSFKWDLQIPDFLTLEDDDLTVTIQCEGKSSYSFKDRVYHETAPEDSIPYEGPFKLESPIVNAWCTVNGSHYRDFIMREVRSKEVIARSDLSRQKAVVADEAHPNVFVSLIDSLARSQFQRGFPQTIEFFDTLEESGDYIVLDFKTYHVLGWHSDGNTKPFIGGYRAYDIYFKKELEAMPDWKEKKPTPLVPCNTNLYTNFEEHGYITSSLDTQCPSKKKLYSSPLVYLDVGFPELCCHKIAAEIPTIFPTQNKNCGRRKKGFTNRHRRNIKKHFRYAESFFEEYSDRPKLLMNYLFEAHLSTSGYFANKEIDPPLVSALKRFHSKNLFNSTIFFLMSDHGLHFGPHLESLEGQIEHKLPVLRMVIPKWWATQHPESIKNLIHNQESLVTSLDIHRTLMHFLVLPEPAPPLYHKKVKEGLSLFEPIPITRTCAEAGVPDEFCVCEGNGWQNLDQAAIGKDKALFDRLVGSVLEQFSSEAKSRNPGTKCSTKLHLGTIKSVSRKSIMKGQHTQGRSHKLVFTFGGEGGDLNANLMNAHVYEKGTGSYEWKAQLTGELEVQFAHRTSQASPAEIEEGGKQAGWCILV